MVNRMGLLGQISSLGVAKAKWRANSVAPGSFDDDNDDHDHKSKKGRRRSPYECIGGEIEDEKPIPIRNCPILQLPMRERILIWKHVENINNLRLVCSRIKADLDHFVGLRGILNEEHPSFRFFATVGLQSINVVDLSSTDIVRFLIHPQLLKSLTVTGEISSNYFAYITEYCPYITSLKIRFSPQTIYKRVYFFPILGQHWGTERTFQFLDTVYLETITKRNDDLTYIHETITALFTKDLSENHIIKKIRISIAHKNSALWEMKLIHWAVSCFANAHAWSLTHVCIEITDKRSDDSLESSSTFVGRMLRRDSAAPNRLRDTMPEFPGADGEDEAPNLLLTRVSNKLSALTLEDWNTFPKLTKLYLAANGECCDYWKAAFTKTKVLTNLFLELKTNDNWPTYCSFIEPANQTLTQIDCYEITRHHASKSKANTKLRRIDASVFQKCKQLHKLSLNFAYNENGVRYMLLNTLRFPRQLIHLQLSWIILQPCDLAKLALSHRQLLDMDISYWSLTDAHFSRFWCLFKWIFFFHLTSLVRLTVTDSKIRFQDGRKAAFTFLKSQQEYSHFLDMDGTCLLFNRRPHKSAS